MEKKRSKAKLIPGISRRSSGDSNSGHQSAAGMPAASNKALKVQEASSANALKAKESTNLTISLAETALNTKGLIYTWAAVASLIAAVELDVC